jgi:hypothetical protein
VVREESDDLLDPSGDMSMISSPKDWPTRRHWSNSITLSGSSGSAISAAPVASIVPGGGLHQWQLARIRRDGGETAGGLRAKGSRPVQPAVKRRGREYLRTIYAVGEAALAREPALVQSLEVRL